MFSRSPFTRASAAGAIAVCAILASAITTRADDGTIAALRGAAMALESDPRSSIEKLLELRESSAGKPFHDIVLYLLATAERKVGSADAAARLEELLERHPDSPMVARARTELIEIDSGRVQSSELLMVLDRFVDGDYPRADVAAFALAVGTRVGSLELRARALALLHVRRIGKGDSIAREAARVVASLRASHPELVPGDADSYFQEAKLCAAEGDLEAQSAWLDRVIASRPAQARLREALVMRARVIASSKGRPAAAEWLEARARDTSDATLRAALLYAAGSHRWNADQDERAIADFTEAISLRPVGSQAQEARYAIGRIHQSHRRYAPAAEQFRRAADGPDAALAAESRWRTGWSAYLSGDFAAAQTEFAAMVTRYPGKEPRGARETALYWQARSTERNKGETEALPLYERVLREFPDGYYAYLVERRTDLSAAPPRPRLLPRAARLETETSTKLGRIAAFDAVGFGDAAAVEVHRLLVRATEQQKRALLPELARVGAHSAALKTSLALYHRNVISESELYPFFYPLAFSHIVDRESASRRLDPHLVYALMKQESLFDRHAVSPASAYGLMQLLVSTARRMAGENEASRIDPSALFEPETNIRLGTTYLAELSRMFGAEPIFMLAGYNAGERAAESWRSRFGQLDPDELVERITYRETRDYVKKVLANHRNYLRLYPRS